MIIKVKDLIINLDKCEAIRFRNDPANNFGMYHIEFNLHACGHLVDFHKKEEYDFWVEVINKWLDGEYSEDTQIVGNDPPRGTL